MSKKKHSAPKISPLATIQFRITTFLASADALSSDRTAWKTHLDALVQGIKPEQFFGFFLPASRNAHEQIIENIKAFLPEWVAANAYAPAFREFITKAMLEGENYPFSAALTGALNIDVAGEVEAKLQAAQNLFVEAFAHDDKEWQCSIIGFWYTDKRKYQQHGFSLLIDRNPPWNGAVKDFFLITSGQVSYVKQGLSHAFNGFNGPRQHKRTETEVKELIFRAFQDSKKNGIRLPHDLIAEKDAFWNFWSKLPDTPLTEGFTREDFNALLRNGKTAESIMHYEQTVGREIIGDNGERIFVGADDADSLMSSDAALFGDPVLQNILGKMLEEEEARFDELDALSTDELWERVQDAGVELSFNEVLEKGRAAFSTEAAARAVLDMLPETDIESENTILMGVDMLCERVLTDIPWTDDVIEEIEDRLGNAYEIWDDGKETKAFEEFIWVWGRVKDYILRRNASPATTKIHSVEDLEEAFSGFNSMAGFLTEDWRGLTESVIRLDAGMLQKALVTTQDMLETLPEKGKDGRYELLHNLAGIYGVAERDNEVEEVYNSMLKEFRTNAELYDFLAERHLDETSPETFNLEKADAIFQQGLAQPDLDEYAFLEQRYVEFKQSYNRK